MLGLWPDTERTRYTSDEAFEVWELGSEQPMSRRWKPVSRLR